MGGANDIEFKNGMGILDFNITQAVLKINKYFLYELWEPDHWKIFVVLWTIKKIFCFVSVRLDVCNFFLLGNDC